jgi:hypothetical protein
MADSVDDGRNQSVFPAAGNRWYILTQCYINGSMFNFQKG